MKIRVAQTNDQRPGGNYNTVGRRMKILAPMTDIFRDHGNIIHVDPLEPYTTIIMYAQVLSSLVLIDLAIASWFSLRAPLPGKRRQVFGIAFLCNAFFLMPDVRRLTYALLEDEESASGQRIIGQALCRQIIREKRSVGALLAAIEYQEGGIENPLAFWSQRGLEREAREGIIRDIKDGAALDPATAERLGQATPYSAATWMAIEAASQRARAGRRSA